MSMEPSKLKAESSRMLGSKSSDDWSSTDAHDEFMNEAPEEKKGGFMNNVKETLGINKAMAMADSAKGKATDLVGRAKFNVTGNARHLNKGNMTMENMDMLGAHDLENNPEIEHSAKAVKDEHGGMKGKIKGKIDSVTGRAAFDTASTIFGGIKEGFSSSNPAEEKAFHRQQALEAGKGIVKKGVGKAADFLTAGTIGASTVAEGAFDLATDTSGMRRGVRDDLMERKHQDPSLNENFLVGQAKGQTNKRFAGDVANTHFGGDLMDEMMAKGKRSSHAVGTAEKITKMGPLLRADIAKHAPSPEAFEESKEERVVPALNPDIVPPARSKSAASASSSSSPKPPAAEKKADDSFIKDWGAIGDFAPAKGPEKPKSAPDPEHWEKF